MPYNAPTSYNTGTYNASIAGPSPSFSLTKAPAPSRSVTADASATTPGAAAIVSYAFSWGDGGTTAAQASPSATHAYAADGTYTVTLTVLDANNASGSVIQFVTIGVVVVPPIVEPPTGFRPSDPPAWNLVNPVPPASLDVVYKVQLDWTLPNLNGGVFVATHIERADDSQGWREIARISNPAVTTFTDGEARANVPAEWRMRVEVDSGFSPYCDPTVNVVPHACGLSFTSNEDPSLDIQRQDIVGDTGRTWDWPELPKAEVWALHSRDKTVRFRPIEDRGDAFDFQLQVWGQNGQPVNGGRQAGEIIRRLLRANVTYICVRDEHGTRWFASLEARSPAFQDKEPEGLYLANLSLIEVASVPSVVDVAA